MTRDIKHKDRDILLTSRKADNRDFDSVNPYNSGDSSLWEKISQYMKGSFDLNDVRNDPALTQVQNKVSNIISDYQKQGMRNKDDEKFIKSNFSEEREIEDVEILDEINQIKLEISDRNINEIAADWVYDWQGNMENHTGNDPKTKEIRDYITSSLESNVAEPERTITYVGRKTLSKYFVKYISLSAAAIVSAFILIKTLVPSYNPEKLFNSYYEPMSIVSPVTRSFNAEESENYFSGIERYKFGDYKSAEVDFSKAMLQNESAIGPRFFLGITNLALGNYDYSINLLSDATSHPWEYNKDAKWYLGLAYLKTGEKEKALGCFEFLAKTPGYYRQRAEEILRHLK